MPKFVCRDILLVYIVVAKFFYKILTTDLYLSQYHKLCVLLSYIFIYLNMHKAAKPAKRTQAGTYTVT